VPLVARYFLGVPLVPTMSTGANERRSLRAVYVGRDFLTDLIKAYAEAD
jgi:hypothetical protein